MNERTRWIVFGTCMVVLLLWLHGRMLNDNFLSDDYDWVTSARERVEQGSWLEAFATETGGNFYRPLVALSFQFDWLLWQYNTIGYHAHQLAFEIILVIGVAWLIREAFQKTDLAFASAALFAAYPSHHEVVTWIAGRPDLYAATFSVLSLATFARFLRSKKRRWYALSLVAALLALLSKEIAFILPLLLAGIVLLVGKRKHYISLLPYVILVAAVLLVRNTILSDALGGYRVGGELTATHMSWATFGMPFISPFVLVNWKYLGTGKAAFAFFVQHWTWFVAAIVSVSVFVFAKKRAFPSRPIVSALAWMLIAFIPVYGLSGAIDTQQLSGSRLFFFSSIGTCLLLATLLWRPRLKVVFAAVFVVFVALWNVNSRPWRMASAYVDTVRKTFAEQQTELLAANPDYLFLRKLPELQYGAYTFFGNHSVSGMVRELTGATSPVAFTVDARQYDASPFCDERESFRPTLADWESDQRRFVLRSVPDRTAVPAMMWDFRDPTVTALWDFHSIPTEQRAEGVVLSLPNTLTTLPSSPAFSPTVPRNYRYLDMTFSFLDEERAFGSRQALLYWGKAGAVSANNYLAYSYDEPHDEQIRIPLCQFLNWSLSTPFEQLRIVPAHSGRVLIRSISLEP